MPEIESDEEFADCFEGAEVIRMDNMDNSVQRSRSSVQRSRSWNERLQAQHDARLQEVRARLNDEIQKHVQQLDVCFQTHPTLRSSRIWLSMRGKPLIQVLPKHLQWPHGKIEDQEWQQLQSRIDCLDDVEQDALCRLAAARRLTDDKGEISRNIGSEAFYFLQGAVQQALIRMRSARDPIVLGAQAAADEAVADKASDRASDVDSAVHSDVDSLIADMADELFADRPQQTSDMDDLFEEVQQSLAFTPLFNVR
jgi:hypothetical protein